MVISFGKGCSWRMGVAKQLHQLKIVMHTRCVLNTMVNIAKTQVFGMRQSMSVLPCMPQNAILP